MKVLIAEDDPTTALLMGRVASKFGSVLHAENGQETYDMFCAALEQGEGFDLIFLDIMMPEVDGQEALQAIREFESERGIVHGQGVKVVMTTCLDGAHEVHEALAQGALEFFRKPIERSKILRVLSEVHSTSDKN